MTNLLRVVEDAVADLCAKFEEGGYYPTPIVDLGVLVARADGVVDTKERQLLRDVFEGLLGTRLSPEVVDQLIQASLDVIEQAGVEARAQLVAEILQDCSATEQGILVALAIAFASEGFSQAERSVIEMVARAARLSPDRFDALVAQIKSKVPDEGSARDSLSGPASRRNLE
jgi:tellurite resistance protein